MGCNYGLMNKCAILKPTFSILYRIEWVVTLGWLKAVKDTETFQYPVSDRMGCNEAWDAEQARRVPDFQYPVSDRMGCNGGREQAEQGAHRLSVSCIGSNGL